MPEDQHVDLATMVSTTEFPDLGSAGAELPDLSSLEDVDVEAIRSHLAKLGLQVSKKRKRSGNRSQSKSVPGKTLVTVHLTDDLYDLYEEGRKQFNLSKSGLVEDAVKEWVEKRGIRRPGTTTS